MSAEKQEFGSDFARAAGGADRGVSDDAVVDLQLSDIHVPGPVTVVHRIKSKVTQGAWWRRLLTICGLVTAGLAALVLVTVVLFRFVAPPGSMMMVLRSVTDGPVVQNWVDIDAVSPRVVRAVIVSEDAPFCEHWGVDWEAVALAWNKAKTAYPRGASTISMQTAKNMYLWPSRSYIRKAIEVPLAYVIDAVWQKRRLLEIYLNVAEWGPGLFGIQQASWHYFNKAPRRLSAMEAALLATALPNPRFRNPRRPSAKHRRLANRLLNRMSREGNVTSCILGGGKSRRVKR